jgi:acyl-CoA reductase-like NAD-dependent aldehyde dehydrogenase
VSLANPGLISLDILKSRSHWNSFQALSMEELLGICGRAADVFMDGDLPLGEKFLSPAEYVDLQSATTGMPKSLCRVNMEKIAKTLREMETVLSGLTRDLDLDGLDKGFRLQEGHTVSYRCRTDSLGAVLPSNSPGVHALWIPSIALKVPVVLKPGRQEPWTPHRIAQAMMAVGCPSEAFSIYPSDHVGAETILQKCGRSLLFGDQSTVSPWRQDDRVQIHGPGWSKVLLFDQAAEDWEDHLDLMVSSVIQNGGRSCTNASSIWTTANGKMIAEKLAERLTEVKALPLDDPNAQLGAFGNKKIAGQVSGRIDQLLRVEGALDVSQSIRGASRQIEIDGAHFILPTVIFCEKSSHPLAHAEYLFPFVAVIQVEEEDMLQAIGPTLVCTVLTQNKATINQALSSRSIDRLNLGSIPTHEIAWDQPHEGNLFEHLFQQRALQSMAGCLP